MRLLLVLLLAFTIFFANPVLAQDDEDLDDVEIDMEEVEEVEPPLDDQPAAEAYEPEPEDYAPGMRPNPDVVLKAVFPGNEDGKFQTGRPFDVLVGVANTGENAFNITFVGGHIHSAYDFNYIIQNVTFIPSAVLLNPMEQTTLAYTVTPDKSLEPINYRLSGYIRYYSTLDESEYFGFYFNQTVELVEPPTELDASSLFSYLLVLSIVGGIGYVGLVVSGSNAVQLPGLAAKRELAPEDKGSWDEVIATRTSKNAQRATSGRRR
jgi:hypothetical protein